MSDSYIGIERVGGIAQTTLRADMDAANDAVREAVGLAPPDALGVVADGARRVIWMSPDELLIVTEAETGETVRSTLGSALSGTHHMVVDVSDARGVIRLTGERVGEVLAKGAPCDLSDGGFPPGTARRTHLGGLAVAIWRTDVDVWEIACFSSLLHHLQAWLKDAAQPGAEVA